MGNGGRTAFLGMTDIQTADQQPTFAEALHVWEGTKIQLEESRVDYLDCKNFGNSTSLFTAAVVLAEAFCMEREAFEVFDGIVAEENRVSVLESSLGDRAAS